MTTQATQYTFTAPINSKGRQGSNWKVEFDWKLPGSKYPFVLYGREDTDIEGWNVGDSPQVTVTQGSLKSGKNGQYPSDFFYDLVSMREADTPTPAPPSTISKEDSPPWDEPGPQYPAPPPPAKDAIQARIEAGMAFNAAVALLIPELPVIGKDRAEVLSAMFSSLRQLRDGLLHGVIQVPVAAPHFCYEHETPRIQSPKTGVWGHLMPQGKPCLDATAPATGRAEPTATKPAEAP